MKNCNIPDIEEGDITGSTYESRSDEQIKDLALQLYKNEIFTSLQVPDNSTHLLPSIFMPLIFMDDLTKKVLLLNEAHCFYAEMKDAGPRSINGYPMFFSMLYLNRTDADRLIKKYNAIKEAMDNV